MELAATEVTLNGVHYVRKDSIKDAPITGDLRIVILQRGWVMVGRFTRDGDECKLSNAAVIRVWGTTKGLPQIANEGTTSKTVLDRCDGVVEFHYLTVIASLTCREDKWTGF